MTPFKSLRFFKHWSCKLQNFDMKTIIFMVIFIMTSVLKVSSTDIKSFEPVPKVVVFHLGTLLFDNYTIISLHNNNYTVCIKNGL